MKHTNVECNMYCTDSMPHSNIPTPASYEQCLGTVHLIFWGGLGIFFRAKKFFSDNFGARLFFLPALRAGLFFFITKSYNIHV